MDHEDDKAYGPEAATARPDRKATSMLWIIVEPKMKSKTEDCEETMTVRVVTITMEDVYGMQHTPNLRDPNIRSKFLKLYNITRPKKSSGGVAKTKFDVIIRQN